MILLSYPAGILFEFIYSVRELEMYIQSFEHNDVLISYLKAYIYSIFLHEFMFNYLVSKNTRKKQCTSGW